jgi:ribonuclease HI
MNVLKNNSELKQVTIYTDGACSGNPGPGGWAALLECNGVEKILTGGDFDTTNNRMELISVIRALEALKEACKVKVYTDSKYVQLGASEWMHKWQLNNWRKGSSIVKNVELWQTLASLVKKHDVEFFWVKGHADNAKNNLVDSLARDKVREYIK